MKTVLIVDDSPSVREQVADVLGGAGYRVVEAEDGLDALTKLANTPEVELVISDINMPQLNGLEMLERIRSEGRHTDVPVIMLTTEGQPALITRAKKSGAKAWIVKPFKPALLVAAVRKFLPN
jgi:two-component system chemotaxis response regulator CheY